MSKHAEWLRTVSEQLLAAGQSGYANTCRDAATHIDAREIENAALQSQLSDMAAREAVYRKALEGFAALPGMTGKIAQGVLKDPSPQAARYVAIEKAAEDVAMKYDDFSEPEVGAPAEYNRARRALYELLTTAAESAG